MTKWNSYISGFVFLYIFAHSCASYGDVIGAAAEGGVIGG